MVVRIVTTGLAIATMQVKALLLPSADAANPMSVHLEIVLITRVLNLASNVEEEDEKKEDITPLVSLSYFNLPQKVSNLPTIMPIIENAMA